MLLNQKIYLVNLVVEVNLAQIKNLKIGKFVVIDGEPCKVVSIEKSKTGKHGAMKARVEALSLFTGSKKTLLKPVDASCEIPIIKRRAAQAIAKMSENRFQFMDLETYETYEMEIDEDFLDKLEAGKEVEVQEVMGKRMLLRVK